MGRTHTPSARAAATDVRLPNGDAASDADLRELINRAHLARELLRGSHDGPDRAELLTGATASVYTVRLGPHRLAVAESTTGARLLVDGDGVDLARTDFAGPPAAFTTGVWVYVWIDDDGAGALRYSQEIVGPSTDYPWYPTGRTKLFALAFRTETDGTPIPCLRLGRRTHYTRWYAGTVFSPTLGSSGTTLASLASRVPATARRVTICVVGVTGPGGFSEADDSTDYRLAVVGAVYEFALDASSRIRFHADGAPAAADFYVVGWED